MNASLQPYLDGSISLPSDVPDIGLFSHNDMSLLHPPVGLVGAGPYGAMGLNAPLNGNVLNNVAHSPAAPLGPYAPVMNGGAGLTMGAYPATTTASQGALHRSNEKKRSLET